MIRDEGYVEWCVSCGRVYASANKCLHMPSMRIDNAQEAFCMHSFRCLSRRLSQRPGIRAGPLGQPLRSIKYRNVQRSSLWQCAVEDAWPLQSSLQRTKGDCRFKVVLLSATAACSGQHTSTLLPHYAICAVNAALNSYPTHVCFTVFA